MDASSRHFIELKTCDRDDPDGRRAASVVAAYFNVEHAQAFRRLLWRQAAVLVVLTLVVSASTSLVPRRGLFIALLTLAAIVAVAAIAEWRATRTLRALL